MRLIAELTKFEIVPVSFTLECFKKLIEEQPFRLNNIEMISTLLTYCGIYLTKHADSS